MLTFTAQNVRSHLGNIFDALEKDSDTSVLIERNNKPVAMLLPAEVGRIAILAAYAHGSLSRSTAMKQLGYEWYGQLLDGLKEAGIARPSIPEKEMQEMVETATNLLKNNPNPKPKSGKP